LILSVKTGEKAAAVRRADESPNLSVSPDLHRDTLLTNNPLTPLTPFIKGEAPAFKRGVLPKSEFQIPNSIHKKLKFLVELIFIDKVFTIF
jgi:hypothetical protein